LGFTLVELSIVLVIIGLILGGVMVGQGMIKQQRLSKMIRDIDVYLTVSQTFADKYGCMPGDCPNATTFWNGVTNGNGNAQINYPGAVSTPGEAYGAWQQLAKAGLITGNYSGTSGTVTWYTPDIGVNVPSTAIPGGAIGWYYLGNQSGSATYYDGYYGNILYVGILPPNMASGQFLSPEDAYSIDLKTDDGIPATGNTRIDQHGTTRPNCTTGANNAGSASVYNLSYTGIACRMAFLTGF
jgi:prepilin-type N-terminal cleavage/methylation domain-containing protein